MLWGCNTIEGVGIIVAVKINIIASKFIAILQDCHGQLLPGIFQQTNMCSKMTMPQCPGPE
jgi:hypothetical protein